MVNTSGTRHLLIVNSAIQFRRLRCSGSTDDVSDTDTSTAALGTTETSTAALGTTNSETSDASGDHTHPVEPGLTEFPTETVTDADLIVNGATVAADINSGEFTETIDVSGELTPGENTIELASDSLGWANLTVRTQLFRRGRVV